MKIIILDSGKTQIYLHINKIHRIYTHIYSHYTRWSVHMNKHKIFISDFQHGDFNQLIYDFIKSNKKLKILKIKDLLYETGEIHVTLIDWVSEAMGK